MRNKEETGSRVPLKNIDGRNWVRVARDGSAYKSDTWLARVGSEADKCFLKATPSLRASLAPTRTLMPPTALVSLDRKEVKQFNTLSRAIAQEPRNGNEVCFRAHYLASSLGAEVDEICHFRSKSRREEEPHRLVVQSRLDDGEQFCCRCIEADRAWPAVTAADG